MSLLLFTSNWIYAQYSIGDYGSMSSGNWTSPIWGTWNGSSWTAIGTTPTSATNVWIISGTTITLPTGGPYSCKNLVVESAAKLWTSNSASNVYLYINGSTFICNGQVGDGANFDGISFGIEGSTCTISGNGIFDASRIRKNTPLNINTNLNIAMNLNLRWNSVSGTQLYNATNNTIFNVTINAFCIVTLIANGPNLGNVCIDGLDGTQIAFEAGGTFTINGTLIISGKLYLTTNNSNSTYKCSWIINGLVKAKEVIASASGVAGNSLAINSGGKLEINGTPSWSSLSTTNNTYNFQVGSTVEYSAAGTQIVRVASEFGTAISNRYYNLILSNSGNKSTLLTDLWVRNDITISGNAVLDPNPGTSNIFIGGNWTNYNSSGFSEKTTTVSANGSLMQIITCPGGEVYYTLRYFKTGSFLQFNNFVDVINQFLFSSNGYVDLNSNVLTVRNPSISGILGENFNRYIVSEKIDNSSKIIWKIGTGVTTTGNPYYTFPFGLPPGGTANYFPVLLTKTAPNDIGDVTISTYGTQANNLPWPSTPTLVSNFQAYYPVYNNPDDRHYTVDRFWQIDATHPVTVDSLRLSYRASELPDLDTDPLDQGAQFWAGTNSDWNPNQLGIPAAYNITVPDFNYYNTSWTITSLISPLSNDALDDGNPCTTDIQDSITHVINHIPINIDDNNSCTIDVCDTVTGNISHSTVNTSDNNACTSDNCDPVSGIFHIPVNISDGNFCTIDDCDPSTGIYHTMINLDDGNNCTIDGCNPANGSISHSPINTNDNNICTTDGCDPVNGPYHTNISTNDGNQCTFDGCDPINGIYHNQINYSDGNLCTSDFCDPLVGEFHVPVSVTDNNACTNDVCDTATGQISHTSINPDDNNLCTVDYCDPVNGIYHISVNVNDNNQCTTDGCDPVNGLYHIHINVNDGNICTADVCDTATGVVSHNPVIVNDGNACTIDGCDPVTGIYHNPSPEICGNGIDDNCNGLIDENCIISLHLRLLIEGYYLGHGHMVAAIDPSQYPLISDTVTVELRTSGYPYNVTYFQRSLIGTNGDGTFLFPVGALNNSYYLVVHHRNALETWSSSPVLFSGLNVNYDFTNAINKAYGNNLADLGDGNFALWSGDISHAFLGVGYQDEVIESQDYLDMENAVDAILLGYIPQDITGDGIVEATDYAIEENNVGSIVFTIRP